LGRTWTFSSFLGGHLWCTVRKGQGNFLFFSYFIRIQSYWIYLHPLYCVPAGQVKFTVHTKTSMPEFSKNEFSVIRLHEDFIWLHDDIRGD
jgi:hypothetical protein